MAAAILLLAALSVVAGQHPRCCDQGYSLVLVSVDGNVRPLCNNVTTDDDDYYSDYDEGFANVTCPIDLLRNITLHDGDHNPQPPRGWVECAEDVDGRKVGLYCNATYFRCCRDGKRYDPVNRTCVDTGDVFLELDALTEVVDGNASRAHWSVECPEDMAVVDDFAPASAVQVLEDGRLRVGTGPDLEPWTFCVEGTTSGAERVVVRRYVDVRRACEERPCFRKCCKDGQALENSTDGCTPDDGFQVTALPITYNVTDALDMRGLGFSRGFAVAVGKYCPEQGYLIDPFSADHADQAVLAANGDLTNDGSVYDVDSYCVDRVVNTRAVMVKMCFPPQNEDNGAIPLYITVGMIMSSAFLFATLLVYALLPALLNLHGKTLMCHVVSLLTAYICLSCIQLGVKDITEKGWCVAIAYTMIFSFMAAFSWLNVMCFDIWWTFSTVRCLTQGNRQQRERRRYLWYNLYSWSLAATVVFATFAGDSAGEAIPEYLRPRIAVETCFYSNRTDGQKLFFELPVALLTTSNIVFFVLTARNCYRVKAELQRLQSKEGERGKRRFEDNKNKLTTTAKLFVVMGVTWVMEFIASFLEIRKHPLLIPADIANSLQGVFIFCIFVLKRKVLHKLGQRLRLKACLGRQRSGDHQHAAAGGPGYELWRVRKISSNSTLYTNSTMVPSGGAVCSRNK